MTGLVINLPSEKVERTSALPTIKSFSLTTADIGRALRYVRERGGLSRGDLGLRTKGRVHRNTIAMAESGRGMHVTTLLILAAALHVSIPELWKIAEEKVTQNSVQDRKTA